MTISPATTRVSLLANAICLLYLIAFIVEDSPAKPTIAANTISMVSISTICSMDFSPANTFISCVNKASLTCWYLVSSPITTALGLNSMACFINKSALLFATNTSTSNSVGLSRTTSNAWVPMLPVLPIMASRFGCLSVCCCFIFIEA